jgi:hypothetical protein
MKLAVPAGRAVLALTAILAAVACGPGAAAPPPEPFEGDPNTVLTISVQNQQLEEARVWLWVDGQRERLGSVRPNQNRTFYFPMDQIRTVHMEFDVTLGQRCVTTDVSLGPGDDIQATIPQNLVAFAGVCRRR